MNDLSQVDKVKLILSEWLPLHCKCQWPHSLDSVAIDIVMLFKESESSVAYESSAMDETSSDSLKADRVHAEYTWQKT